MGITTCFLKTSASTNCNYFTQYDKNLDGLFMRFQRYSLFTMAVRLIRDFSRFALQNRNEQNSTRLFWGSTSNVNTIQATAYQHIYHVKPSIIPMFTVTNKCENFTLSQPVLLLNQCVVAKLSWDQIRPSLLLNYFKILTNSLLTHIYTYWFKLNNVYTALTSINTN